MCLLQAPCASRAASLQSRNVHVALKQSLLIYIHKSLKPQCMTWSVFSLCCTSVVCGPGSSECARRENFKLWQELSTNKLKEGFEKSPKRQVFKLKHLHYFHLNDCLTWSLINIQTQGWIPLLYDDVDLLQWCWCLWVGTEMKERKRSCLERGQVPVSWSKSTLNIN